MDLIGKKMYTTSSFQMQIVNNQALLSKYNFVNWTAVSNFADQLSKALREEYQMVIANGCLVANVIAVYAGHRVYFGQNDGLSNDQEKGILAAEFEYCS